MTKLTKRYATSLSRRLEIALSHILAAHLFISKQDISRRLEPGRFGPLRASYIDGIGTVLYWCRSWIARVRVASDSSSPKLEASDSFKRNMLIGL